ncbi:hypothetical protein V1477_010028 [Vespula maculifrons]|uniref:Uncharacterized protein n=1 Tax=Vespula maculifrons TaxID=7453 RepID=A0ABD2CBR1_VESMC
MKVVEHRSKEVMITRERKRENRKERRKEKQNRKGNKTKLTTGRRDIVRVGGRNENDRPTRELRVIANRVSVVLLAATAAAAAVAAAVAAAAAVKSSSHSNSSNSSSQSVCTILLFAQNYLAKIAVLTST